jgi:hypothetical protein
MGAKIVVRAIALIAAAALIWVGIAFAGYAIATALAPSLGIAGGAAIAALVLLLPPVCAVLTTVAMQGSRRRAHEESFRDTEDTVISILSVLARDRPLMAVMGAALVGVAGVLLRGRKR